MPKPSRKSRSKPRKVKRAGRASGSLGGGFYVPQKSKHRPFKKKERFPAPKGPLPKSVRDQIAKARGYKRKGQNKASALARKYNRALAIAMVGPDPKHPNYTKEDIKRAQKFRLSGRAIRAKAVAVNVRFSSDGKTAYVLGRGKGKQKTGPFKGRVKMSKAQFSKRMKGVIYRAQIAHYQALYGLSKKEAQALRRSLKDEKFGAAIFKALY